VPFDTDPEHFVERPLPPIIREDLDLGIAGITLRLDRAPQRSDVDDSVAHHTAVVEDVLGRHQPVADVEGQDAVAARARDLVHHLRIPPDVIDVERDTDAARTPRIKPIADIECLLDCVHAGAVAAISLEAVLPGLEYCGKPPTTRTMHGAPSA
jgi:hypothetical protein